ncbi:MAG: ribosome maturation factor RimM [bacterium]
MNEGDLISLGVILSVHGLKGNLKGKTYSGRVDNLSAGSFLYIKKSSGEFEKVKVKRVIPQRDIFLISFEGVNSVEQALPFEKGVIYKEKSELLPTEEDEYYFVDLLGLSVFTLNGAYLGKIEEIIETGANVVISVKHGKEERLFPFIKDVIRDVNLSEKKLILDATGYIDED